MIRRFARPYAKAIMDVAGSPENAEKILVELSQFERAQQTAADLREMLSNPGVEVAGKRRVVAEMAKKLALSDLGSRFLDVLVQNQRISDLASVLAAVQEMIHEAQGIVIADVRSAEALDSEDVSELREALEKRLGRKVQVEVRVDPTLLGGFVAQVGSEVYDASVTGRIHKIRQSIS